MADDSIRVNTDLIQSVAPAFARIATELRGISSVSAALLESLPQAFGNDANGKAMAAVGIPWAQGLSGAASDGGNVLEGVHGQLMELADGLQKTEEDNMASINLGGGADEPSGVVPAGGATDRGGVTRES
jgi:hypothetical protein